MASWLQISVDELKARESFALKRSIVQQRLRKERAEVAEIEKALKLTGQLHHLFMERARPGMRESELWGRASRRVIAEQSDFSYPPIITTAGEVLHQHVSQQEMGEQALLLVDMGVDSPAGYASDITRTFPVSGYFTTQQREIYEIVLAGQQAAIAMMAPGVSFRDVHLHCCVRMVEGLVELGLMQGDPQEAVASGAHALLFPHGLGHALGLDVHDMEDLGDEVGYGGEGLRSNQFGLNFLRFGRTLEEGYVMTVEPGLYFIPALFEQWKADRRFEDFLNYERIEPYLGFGGIRIEDDVLVTRDSHRVLGSPIARSVQEVEAQMALGWASR
jgi:Xaa-Pro aminopeptidase